MTCPLAGVIYTAGDAAQSRYVGRQWIGDERRKVGRFGVGALLGKAGFRLTPVASTESAVSVVEAFPV